MKRLAQILLVLVVALNLSSCHTTEKFVVCGAPGTEIYSPSKERLGVINYDGIAEIKLSSDGCYTFLLSKDNSSPFYIPFALDYENKSYTGTKALCYTGGFVFMGGVLLGLATGIAAISGADDAASSLAKPTIGLLISGGAAWGATAGRISQTTRKWNFTYRKTQQVNSDLYFIQPVFTEPGK